MRDDISRRNGVPYNEPQEPTPGQCTLSNGLHSRAEEKVYAVTKP